MTTVHICLTLDASEMLNYFHTGIIVFIAAVHRTTLDKLSGLDILSETIAPTKGLPNRHKKKFWKQ